MKFKYTGNIFKDNEGPETVVFLGMTLVKNSTIFDVEDKKMVSKLLNNNHFMVVEEEVGNGNIDHPADAEPSPRKRGRPRGRPRSGS